VNNTLVNIHTIEQLLEIMKDLLHDSLTQESNREIINDLNRASQLQVQLTLISKQIRDISAKNTFPNESVFHKPYWATPRMITYVAELYLNQRIDVKNRIKFIKGDLNLTEDKAKDLLQYYEALNNR